MLQADFYFFLYEPKLSPTFNDIINYIVWCVNRTPPPLPLKGKAYLLSLLPRREKSCFHRLAVSRPNKNKIITTNKKRAGFNLLACFYYVPLAAEAFFFLSWKKNQKHDNFLSVVSSSVAAGSAASGSSGSFFTVIFGCKTFDFDKCISS